MFALFQESGQECVVNDKFHTWVITGVSNSAWSFQIQNGILSGPVAVVFILVSEFQTCLSDNWGALTSCGILRSVGRT